MLSEKFNFSLRLICFFTAAALTLSTIPALGAHIAFDGEILRFHVIANSDTAQDQALKLKVRDHVLEVSKSIFSNASNARDAENAAIANLTLLREAALDVINEEGFTYNVTVSCGVYNFPIKSYGTVTLPAGNYNAVRIVIGKGEGHNWWCVMYPPLCFIKENAKFPAKTLASLSNATRSQICDPPKIKIKWKIAEIFN
ncbi:MAG: stage II sporulation protein R [Bacillota bacterium]|nr:stage II sporulation protein R [Bacillota bacterium]